MSDEALSNQSNLWLADTLWRLGAVQFRLFGHMFGVMRHSLKSNQQGISPFQALATSLAARVTIKAFDNLGETAEDVYLVEYAGTGIVVFQGEEWIRFFQ